MTEPITPGPTDPEPTTGTPIREAGPISTEWIEIEVPGAPPMRAYLARPDSSSTRTAPGQPAAVIVCHELFGVNPDIQEVTKTLAEQGFLAIAPQFYHRSADPDLKLVRDDEGRRIGFEQLHLLERDQALADVQAVLTYLGTRTDTDRPDPDQPGAGIGLLGFSAGGHLAFLAATALPIAGTVVLYGGWLASTGIPLSRPEPTLGLAAGITEQGGELLYLVGGRDTLIPDTQVKQLREELDVAVVRHEVIVYPEAEHAYFWPGTPSYDADATADSWRRLLAFFDRSLRVAER
jgi:carboxymethylenebutenolidase